MRLKERAETAVLLEDLFPKSWERSPIKYSIRRETRRSNEEATLLSLYRDYGVIPKDSRDDNHNRAGKDLGAYLLVNPGDLVINKMKAWQGSIAVSDYEGIVSPAYFVYSVDSNIHGRFLHYQLRSLPFIHEYRRFSSGVRPNQWDLDPEDFGRIEVHFPEVKTQKAIANFLDRKTAAIDALIEKKEKLLELLAEKRSALINQAVTKGLDPNVPMKNSGIPWIGEIPEHWEISKIRYISSIVSKGTTPSTVGGEMASEGIRFLKAENIRASGQVSPSPGFFITEETDALIRRSRLKEHDVLVVIAGATTGKTAVLDARLLPANTNQAVSFIRPLKAIYANYLTAWLNGPQITSQVWLSAVQSAQPNLSMENLRGFPLPVPPDKEIDQINRKLTLYEERFSNGFKKLKKQLQTVREYRQSLITAAVTGQLEIPTEDFA